MTDEILKKIYEIRRNSKYFDEYKSVCEGTEKIYNLVWNQILEKAFLNNERFIYVNIGHSSSLTNLRHLSDDPRYKNYFKLHDSLTKDIWWFSFDIYDENIIFFVMDDLKEKLVNDGLQIPDQPPYGVRFFISKEKLNEFIALAEEKYSTTKTLRRNLQN